MEKKASASVGLLVLGAVAALGARLWVERVDLRARSQPSPLVISEIMYDPPTLSVEEQQAGVTDAQALEFLEFLNVSDKAISLDGLRLVGGARYEFREQSLAPGSYLVVAKDPQAFRVRYPDAPEVAGPYFGDLKNDGEDITLIDRAGRTVCQATYRATRPWPSKAEGFGQSLVLLHPTARPDPTQPESWAASLERGGSPGRADAP